MLSSADCVSAARFPTSLATTANPLPYSPALDDSMDAFSDKTLVFFRDFPDCLCDFTDVD